MPGRKKTDVSEEDPAEENVYIKEEEDSDAEEEEMMSDAGDDDDEVEGFKMPNVFDNLGFDFGDWGGIITMFVLAVIVILLVVQYMEIDLFDMPSFLGGGDESAGLLDGAEASVE
tara:strand:+ start:5765 stop:6109 length:345 start_codon:yes stop_codon:yes gene_type:complete